MVSAEQPMLSLPMALGRGGVVGAVCSSWPYHYRLPLIGPLSVKSPTVKLSRPPGRHGLARERKIYMGQQGGKWALMEQISGYIYPL